MEHSIDAIFNALADPTRREILAMLRGCTLPAGRIAEQFSQQRPAISKHLTILKRAGLVVEQRQAQQRIYSVGFDSVSRAVGALRAMQVSDVGRVGAPKVVVVSEMSAAPVVLESRSMWVEEVTPRPVRVLKPSFDLDFD